ncbi:serine/threonine protein kinase [Xenorhabdus nematophila]|uniref:Stress response kinase A n=2 Tax=Xenorhabdus nematophila TaxID=628 RepID=D3VEA0_XENNA|nr:serine/threonine protein kinase [Xenorhabdus nematophila]AYA41913.1 serine/threonine protein kinase [Xenorhabdus nematophila]MBA0020642.1 serine/threonine protein kinase [Xenorhabdus nematophila]MCB4425293.1 serine/threonine protein kinase [Xenorhabdus nematophila]QNJ36286.1 serine/threonine protein kinase [Xenorhabdus nematophila]CBJ92351.1 Protein rdoA [Xenorhabdus nematophila ATCC 19061]
MTEPKAFNFQNITPDLIMDALVQSGLYINSGLTELNSYENRVYQFMDEDRQRYVVKFYRPLRWNQQQIQEEHDFALELQQADLPVAAPMMFDGQTVLNYGGFFFAIFLSVGGRQYESDNFDQLEDVGKLLGKIHQMGRKKTFSARPTLSLDEYLYQPYQYLAECELIPTRHKGAFFAALDKLNKAVAVQWHDNWEPLRLHGDCHAGNILWRDEAWFVDLDDARNGPAVQDLWMLLNGSRQERLIQLDIVLESYSQFMDFDPKTLSLVEPLRAMRMVYYLAWVARRWQDPAFPKAFPWMADSDFWLKQISLFSEQVRLLQEPPLQLNPIY